MSLIVKTQSVPPSHQPCSRLRLIGPMLGAILGIARNRRRRPESCFRSDALTVKQREHRRAAIIVKFGISAGFCAIVSFAKAGTGIAHVNER